MPARLALPALALALVVSGCIAVVPVVTDGGATGPGSNYSRAAVQQIVAAGPVPTEIHGNPSDLEHEAFRALVIDRLRLPAVWGKQRFSTDPDPAPAHNYRVVLVFNPELDGAHSPATQPRAPDDSPARFDLALCRGDIRAHDAGPYPPLPAKTLERVRERRLSPISPRFLEERILIQGALCLGDVPVSASFVEWQELEDYSEPEFDQLLAQLMLRLMPYRVASGS